MLSWFADTARRAAELSGVRLVEATVPREAAVRLLTVTTQLRLTRDHDLDAARTWFTPAADITHRIDVRPFVAAKQRALGAHRSEINGPGRVARLMRILRRLPAWLIAPVVRTEHFIEPGTTERSDRLL